MPTLLKALARLPLGLFHCAGAVTGRLGFLLDKTYARRITDNLAASGLSPSAKESPALARLVAAEIGKSVLELLVVWYAPPTRLHKLVRDVQGWSSVEAALAKGKGIIFLTPHLGCFELASVYYSLRHPLTVLYRPPKLKWLHPLLHSGRQRAQAKLAPTNIIGVKRLLHALRRGEAIGLLPDQVPSAGEGVWADFFHRPAYTMTLPWRLAERTGAAVFIISVTRLARAQGYDMRFEPFAFAAGLNAQSAARLVNHALEEVITQNPTQYLWSYNRYKIPGNLPPAP